MEQTCPVEVFVSTGVQSRDFVYICFFGEVKVASAVTIKNDGRKARLEVEIFSYLLLRNACWTS